MVPVGDFLGQPVFHSGFGFLYQRQLCVFYFLQVFRDNCFHRVTLDNLFQALVYPLTFFPVQDRVNSRVAIGQRPVIQVGRIVRVAGYAMLVSLHVQHAFRYNATVTGTGQACVLDRVFKIEQDSRGCSRVPLIHEDGPAFQEVPVTLQYQIGHRIKQGMARTYKSSQRESLWRHQ